MALHSRTATVLYGMDRGDLESSFLPVRPGRRQCYSRFALCKGVNLLLVVHRPPSCACVRTEQKRVESI